MIQNQENCKGVKAISPEKLMTGVTAVLSSYDELLTTMMEEMSLLNFQPLLYISKEDINGRTIDTLSLTLQKETAYGPLAASLLQYG